MDIHTMCKESREGIGLSAIDLSDVRHTSAAAVHQRGVALCKQARDALGTGAAWMHAPCYRESIIHQAVFAPGAGRIEECRRIIPESQHLGNLVTQTHGTVVERLGLARDYIKRKEDYPWAREACQKVLGELPTICVLLKSVVQN